MFRLLYEFIYVLQQVWKTHWFSKVFAEHIENQLARFNTCARKCKNQMSFLYFFVRKVEHNVFSILVGEI